jgi:hypothetical protein
VQGVWLALLTTSGSLARVVGPLFVTDLYQEYGTYVTFGVVTGTEKPQYGRYTLQRARILGQFEVNNILHVDPLLHI